MKCRVSLLMTMAGCLGGGIAYAQVPSDLVNKLNGQSSWPLTQLNLASNCPTPAMGWNSWFAVGDVNNGGPSESNILATADAMVSSGLAAAGYKYVVIDCTWIAQNNGSRDGSGNLIVDPVRWPHGMKYVSDYVHSKGLLMGGYTDIGTVGYGGPSQIGSYGYYQQDANQFAAWEWDFIKIDDHGPGDFAAIATAIHNNASHRPIVVSLCTPTCDGAKFATRIGNSFRVRGDIAFAFGHALWDTGPDSGLTAPGILGEFETAQDDWYSQAPGCFGDPDMLLTGDWGISDTEGRTQFNLWSILGAPLMIGIDVRPGFGSSSSSALFSPPISATTLTTFTNLEVIAIDQDPLCAVGRPVGGTNVYAKPLGSFTSGQYAVLLLNRSSSAASFTVNWGTMGLVTGSTATVRDLWAHQDLGSIAGGYTSPSIPAHGSMMLKVTGTFDWNRPRIYEAESGFNTLAGSAYFIPHETTFSSGAYVTGVGQGAANTLQFNKVAAQSSGSHTLDIYYGASSTRSAQLSVNGGATTTLSFPSTGSDTQPGFIRTSVTLNAGLNTLLFSNASGPAPNFDRLVVSNAVATNSGASFVAYDDCGWTANSGQFPSANDPLANFTTNSPLALPSGYLVDTNGAVLPVQVTFTTNSAIGPGFLDRVMTLPVGSDAEYWFAGKIGTNCAANWTGGHVDMSFSGLNTGKQYNIVLWSTRGTDGAAYSNRFTDITISGADNFTNCSSTAAERLTVSMANDKTRVRSALTPGVVARYDGVKAGSDGVVTFTLTAGGDLLWPSAGVSTNGYLNAVAIMTSTNVAPPAQTNPAPVVTNWTAYNDTAWHNNGALQGQESTALNYTTNSPWGGQTTGSLIDTNGTPLSAQVAFVYSGTATPSLLDRVFTIPSATPADTLFSGHIGPNNAINWTQGTVTMTLSGLSTGKQYTVALWSSRGFTSASYSNRWTDIVISSVDSFVNDSTTGNAQFTSAQAGDGTRVVAIIEGGRVARYDQIRCGSDGTVVFQLTANGLAGTTETNGYLNGFMVQELPISGGTTNDANGDGAPDSWEIQYFGSTTVDLTADPDHDGRNNLHEYIAGTSPTSGSSAPALNIMLLNGNVSAEFSGVTQRLYSIDFKTNLLSPWTPLVSNIAGSNALQDVTLTTATGAGYYRFRVHLP